MSDYTLFIPKITDHIGLQQTVHDFHVFNAKNRHNEGSDLLHRPSDDSFSTFSCMKHRFGSINIEGDKTAGHFITNILCSA